ncbi:MAG: hypothetical protein N2Z22_07790, partial [Turneriella sp.]|nr:hypothetical protein [Turneriella sp.]
MGEMLLQPQIKPIEKTLARVALEVPDQNFASPPVLLIRDKKSGAEKSIILKRGIVEQELPLVFLDLPHSRHHFLYRVTTGKQPKSALFITATKVVLPLLKDDHTIVLDVATAQKQRLILPEKYARKIGFVESVLIPERGEFWVSQMTTAAIHRFAVDSLEYQGTIALSSSWTKVLAYNPQRGAVYASNWQGGDISVISIQTLAEISKIRLGSVPRGMAFSGDGNTLLVALFGGKSDTDRSGGTVTV